MITVSNNTNLHDTAPNNTGTQCIIAQPNCSADWKTNKQLLIYLGILAGIISTTFGMLGIWAVAPIAGIEITALGGALYIVCRRQQQRHVLYFLQDHVVIEKGTCHPTMSWCCSKESVSIIVQRQSHPWDPIKLSLCYLQGSNLQLISIGDFLNKTDSQQLLNVLRQQGLVVSSDSSCGAIVL